MLPHVYLSTTSAAESFEGVKIYTGPNRASLMIKRQYQLYFKEFDLQPRINKTHQGTVKGIGGRRATMGAPLIQIPFTGLGIHIYIVFRIIEEPIPSIIS